MTGLDGTGIGIAVLDSGIDTGHASFLESKGNGLRVVYSKDFTGEGRTDDPHGHGTHVASIAAGNGRVARAEYVGIAPNANIINLRVLNSQGTGRVSYILGALEWVYQNRALYNIRVVNMSLGTAAVESYKNDPVCKAVRRLVDAGVVVVAAAGNNGKDASGQKLYGAIHSPGSEPSVITVGATNTFGTDARSDDARRLATARAARRAAPGWTDALGVAPPRQPRQARPRRARQQDHRRGGRRQLPDYEPPRTRRGREQRGRAPDDVPERDFDGDARGGGRGGADASGQPDA